MAEPTLVQVFGENASQTSTTITITKADLTGLTASANNTAESLLVAINLKAKEYLTQTNFDANIDQSIVVADGFSSLTTRGTNNTPYRTDQITVSFSKVDSNATIDPDDY
ncbi:hypothetical protein Nos7524_3094 [Nostoc sp. PCC 7524]|uniref:hypothetical protein n=1 Tax=Nostoc sp. (strain ATCC 29411 / PCC 7524) TaxID=28072 RepID=UPI00029EFCA7|nr:hypothetical protein [Nostoc sp. PCC 7524]AFY48897.1 hypothetical protein Nos7524_3094 [Nostoc sp. PCC 7524]